MDISDLFRQAIEGDSDASRNLFKFLTDRFRVFARRRISGKEDADEVVQNALAAVAAKYTQLENLSNPAGWAHRVLEIEILRYYRAHYLQERKLAQLQEEGHPFAEWSPNPDFRRALLGCLGELTQDNRRYARVLNLHFQGFTVDEVCRMLGVTRNNYYVILSRARTWLERCLEKRGIEQ